MAVVRRFYVNSALFLLPLLVLSVTVVIVDPFEYFGIFHTISHEAKQETSYRLNYALWKLIHFRRDPKPNLLLGDSRMNQLPTAAIERITGKSYANLSYGSGTLDEVCSTFWEASSHVSLESVYIGLNLNLYNAYNSRDRVTGTKGIFQNPFLYLINRDVIKGTFLLLKRELSVSRGNGLRSIEDPGMSASEFWDYQLSTTTTRYYYNYSKPVRLYRELQLISRYCSDRGIKLVFVIFPTHEDLRSRVRDFGLDQAEDQLRTDLKALGLVYDFDYSNDFTQNRDNFKDPYHLTDNNAVKLVRDIWGGHPVYARVYQRG